MSVNRLQGIRVLVTRPAQQAAEFCAAIESEAGIALRLPLLAIQANDNETAKQRCHSVADYDLVIFISTNAVSYALPLLPHTDWPGQTRIAAIGRATADTLESASLNVDVLPERASNSEAMLEALACEDLHDKRVLIVRGKGGRETLAKGLGAKGAIVDYAEVYQRVCPDVAPGQLASLLQGGIDIITVASGETLFNLTATIKNSDLDVKQTQDLLDLPLVVASGRIAELASQSGFTGEVIVTDEPGRDGFINAIASWQDKV